MREILFRGFNKENGCWFYGLLGKFDGKHYIITEGGVKPFVDSESVGQYTGYDDFNDVKIFEGDIIRFKEHDTPSGKDKEVFGVIVFDEGDSQFQVKDCNGKFNSYLFNDEIATCRVVGNVYEENNAKQIDESLCDSCENDCKDDSMIVDGCSEYKEKLEVENICKE